MTRAELFDLFDIDLEAGTFRWRVKTGGRVKVGEVAGNKDRGGYLNLMVRGRRYGLHRLMWLAAHGSFPEFDIDHINGDKADNRLSNLRGATRSQNLANLKRMHPKNTSGVRGVFWNSQKAKWQAKHGQSKHIGFFASIEEARAAYDAFSYAAHGEFYPGQPQANQAVAV